MTPNPQSQRAARVIRRPFVPLVALFGLVVAASGAGLAVAQEEPAPAAQTPEDAPQAATEAAEAEEARPTGLPSPEHWTFNLDAGAGWFGFSNSLYTNSRPDPSGDLSDNWAESFIKPAISMSFEVGGGELYGKLSTVGERTFSAPPPAVGDEAASFQVEDLHLGWRSGDSIGESENLLEFTGGRAQYRIGHGMLLWDGAGEGGSRGGFWSNARKAWELAGIIRVKPGPFLIEGFYLDRDELPENDSDTKVWGGNFELTLGEEGTTTLGASYMDFSADPAFRPTRDGMEVFNARLYTSPFSSARGFSFESEWAREKNGDLMQADAWMAQVAYEFGAVPWTPKVYYRYAFFEGDDVSTARSENFDMLMPGFYDWGTWWQGEILGEYIISNSNMITNQVRLHLVPSDSVGFGFITFLYQLDEAAPYGPGVTSRDVAVEFDAYCDWKINSNFTASFVAAYANPRQAVEQAFGRTEAFTFGMIYLAYSY